MTSTKSTTITVSAIDPSRLEAIRRLGVDEHGNTLLAHEAEGWEPLRCCLQIALAAEPIALIAYSPFAEASPWAETGPVFIHSAPCDGYTTAHDLPARQRTGPKILRTYRADNTLDYDHIRYVAAGDDIEPQLEALLTIDEVATVHVRAALAQCFGYAVTGVKDRHLGSTR